MSERERDRARVVRQAMECSLSQQEAATRLGIGVRQFKRVLRAWKQDGAPSQVSCQRGPPPHTWLAAKQCTRIAALLAREYENFWPTLAS
ncbi:MAG: helix-turn-helix domain-containing protein [Acetobacteraceae bacterium]|nr:helix-turn-helix domain-containing protein [Acetobacteraceae bacterium]